MSRPISALYVTLRRSFAGTKETQVRTLQAMGFTYREQTIRVRNTPAERGKIFKVKHLVSVESDLARSERLAAEAARRATREPVRIQHPPS